MSKTKFTADFYKSNYQSFSISDLVPEIRLGRNVQGYYYTKTITIQWLRWATTFRHVTIDNLCIDRSDAHELNVKKYMQ